MSTIVQLVWAFIDIALFGGLEWKLTFSSGPCWVFQTCCHIECSTFTASCFRIWNSSAGIPSPPLALFVVMLPKARLTLHSRMSGPRWVITPSWLSGSWRSFLYSSSVYSCYLFLISSSSVLTILSFIVPIFVWNVLLGPLFSRWCSFPGIAKFLWSHKSLTSFPFRSILSGSLWVNVKLVIYN